MVCGSGCPVPEAHPTLSRFHTHNPAPKGTVKSGCVNITWGALARGGALPENVWSGDLQRSLYLFFRPLSGQPKPRAAADGKWKRGHKKEKSLCLFTSCKEHQTLSWLQRKCISCPNVFQLVASFPFDSLLTRC